MLFRSLADKAFDKTTGHPLNENVRVTKTFKGLAAIMREQVQAVIWQKSIPANVQSDFLQIDPWPDRSRDLQAPRIKSVLGITIINDRDSVLDLPKSLVDDIASMNNHFRRATGAWAHEIPSSKSFMRYDFFTESLNRLIVVKIIEPHRDERFRYRLVTAYADPTNKQETVWYPGLIDAMELQRFSGELIGARDMRVLLNEFDSRHNAQTLNSGDVIIFKGGQQETPDRAIVHRGPFPRTNVPRLSLVIS